METVLEIQERNDSVTVIERNLKELHQVFMDMAVLVEHQGEQLDNIESHVNRDNSYVTRGLVLLLVGLGIWFGPWLGLGLRPGSVSATIGEYSLASNDSIDVSRSF
ncbi:hypothetical protein L1987_64725 [Smallanthus sonchifolius]|uniref:Uncharacterized protein n=1 Tax=Smallanthus sonchifolius TaxID=185202 RepID=A0ACB9BSI1_9ASTR|nr:hypothetical protein L1987_64725 [Smallanthus sonchifolius]